MIGEPFQVLDGGGQEKLVVSAGADAGSKARKAAELGVMTLSEEDWLKLIGRA